MHLIAVFCFCQKMAVIVGDPIIGYLLEVGGWGDPEGNLNEGVQIPMEFQ